MMPIIIGVGIFCMTQFGSSYRFSSLDLSVMMLWSLMNGDEVQNIYHALIPISLFGATVVLYTWVFMSNNWLGNFFLAITEDGYIYSKRMPLNRWIKEDVEDPVSIDIDYEGHEDF